MTERIEWMADWPMAEYGVDKCTFVGCDVKKPHMHKFESRTELTQAGKTIASIALLTFGGGMGYAIIDWDFRWALLAIVTSVTLLAIAGIYRKRV